jgi:RNA polymerase sigma-70 factor (ECF subfamily)
MMTVISSTHATVKERPVTTLDQQPAKAEGRKDPWGVLLEKVGKHRIELHTTLCSSTLRRR